MDALDALSPDRVVLSTRLRRGRDGERAAPVAHPDRVQRLVSQLPTLVRGGWSPAVSVSAADALLRLEAAVWELAARRDVPVGPDATVADLARKLAGRGAVSPPAAEAVASVVTLLAHDTGRDFAARVTAYLELRARFG